MGAIQQILSSYGAAANTVVQMDFDDGNGSSVFTDTGSAGSVWTRSGTNVQCSTGQVLQGVSSLTVPGSTDYLETPYSAANCLPATANWDIQFRVYGTNFTSHYMVSAQDTTFTAAGTAFAIATNSGNQMQVVLSDGSTRSVIFTGSGGFNTSTNLLVLVTRRGNTIQGWINGLSQGSGTFSGAINLPAGRKLRIGTAEASNSPPTGMYFDEFRIVRY